MGIICGKMEKEPAHSTARVHAPEWLFFVANGQLSSLLSDKDGVPWNPGSRPPLGVKLSPLSRPPTTDPPLPSPTKRYPCLRLESYQRDYREMGERDQDKSLPAPVHHLSNEPAGR